MIESKKAKSLLVIGLVFLLAIAGAGCAQDGDNGTGEQTEDGTGEQTEEKSVNIAYVDWASAEASTNVVKEVYEEAGYEVELNNVEAGLMYQGIANDDADFSVCAWLPETQADYWEEYSDQIDRVGTNTPEVKTGLVVPESVDIDSIEDLKGNEDMFDGTITGIDSGAGIMSQTETAIEEYELDEYELQSSSDTGMTTSLKSAISDDEPIVVTLWDPHWAFARWDLKYLDDPKDVYGEDDIVTIARQGLQEDKPEAYAILERFNWDLADNEQVMAYIEEGMSGEEAAEKWVEDNPDKVNAWLGEEE